MPPPDASLPDPAAAGRPSLAARLHAHPVFARLDEALIETLAARWQEQSFAAGERIVAGPALRDRLGLLLAGRLQLERDADFAAPATLQAGDLFGAGSVPHDRGPDWIVTAAEPSHIAFLDAPALAALCVEQPVIAPFFAAERGDAAPAERGADPHLFLLTTPVRALLKRPPVTLPPTTSVGDTARTMRDQRVSSVLLIEQEHLFGVVTDRDLRNRALAAGLDPATPVLEIATVAPLTMQIGQPAFEALLMMARHNIHHVPVLDGQRVVGMVTATDLTEQHSTSAVYLAGEIHKQTGIEGLQRAASKVKQLQRTLVVADASAYSTGHIVTAITDAITVRLLQLAEMQLGPAPIDYAWVAAGSQARSEQTARSDQDNCLILDDAYDPAVHGAYFEALARFVTAGLDACGYVYCPGEMMASTEAWRQPQRRWAEYFDRWISVPEPKALMLTCVFFDLRLIHGTAALLDDLRRDVLRRTREARIFLALMTGNALSHKPPLSIFGGISTTRRGERRDTVDLKHQGIVPIVDLARIYALAAGHEAVNTHDRLLVAAESREISESSARDLREALEFLSTMRVRHQAAQTARGEAADNYLSIGTLSNFERGQLKDAFDVVATLQSVLSQRYR